MRFSTCSWLAALWLLCIAQRHVDAKTVLMRPLSATQVYEMLREAGREDAVPEGRVVSQGLAALTGFSLGLTKGIGGSILFDVLTANITQLGGSIGGSSGGSSGGGAIKTEEICFTSRSARDLDEGAVDNYQVDEGERTRLKLRRGRRLPLGKRHQQLRTRPRADELFAANFYGNADFKDDNDDEIDESISGRQVSGSSFVYAPNSLSDGSYTGWIGDGNSETHSTDSTSDDKQPATNCIVIEK